MHLFKSKNPSRIVPTIVLLALLLFIIIICFSASVSCEKLFPAKLLNIAKLQHENSLTIMLDNSTIIIEANNTTGVNGTADSVLSQIITSTYFTAFVSSTFASIIAILITLVIEKFGAQIGGIIGSLPTTVCFASVGFAFQLDNRKESEILSNDERTHILLQQLFVIPLAIFCSFSFLVVWKFVPDLLNRFGYFKKIEEIEIKGNEELEELERQENVDNEIQSSSMNSLNSVDEQGEENLEMNVHLNETIQETIAVENNHVNNEENSKLERKKHYLKLFIISVCSVLVWFSLASIVVLVTKLVNVPDPVLIGVSCASVVMVVLSSIIFNWKVKVQSGTSTKKGISLVLLALRGIFTFSIVFISIVLSGFKFIVVSGLLSVFPIIFLSTLISLWLSSEELTTSSASSMMMGTSSISLFAMIFCSCVIYHLNIFLALLIGFVTSVALYSIPSYFYVRWRKSVAMMQIGSK